ncbi:claspin-like, partial [Uranotaenia lowii]|uniref:claspin-like n=1 Tax=Uranotaenia lowii TaxID=190385 RepID=UPI002479EA66
IGSSDEEDHSVVDKTRIKKKHKRKNLKISDDEETDSETEPLDGAAESETEEPKEPDEQENDDEEEVEHLVDYDSEENEVEVVMNKKEKQKMANAFLEKEAELSESEWGSADEDEKDLDRYDIELGDEEKFDQNQLQQELERIHMRRILEQDKKDVKTLQDMFFEDEENDGVGRERQFRWRNVETTFSLDYDKKPDEDNTEQGASDDENEMQWRKMRYEREMLLKEKNIDPDELNLSTTLVDKSLEEEEENNSNVHNTTTNASLVATKRRITIVKAKKSTETKVLQDSPFLITKSSIIQGNKASFLSRDDETLSKLATLVKGNPDSEGSSSVVASKGRNFVFAAVSPVVDKMGTNKRSLETGETVDDDGQTSKKIKTSANGKPPNETKKRLLLGQLL